MEIQDLLYEDPMHNVHLTGLARKCPACGLIAHYKVKGRKPVEIECVECDHKWTVQKYKRGERPK